MQVYLEDKQSGPSRRRWEEMLPKGFLKTHYSRLDRRFVNDDAPDTAIEWQPGLIVMHSPDQSTLTALVHELGRRLEFGQRLDLSACAVREDGYQDVSALPRHERLHYRKTGVSRPVDRLFGVQLMDFLRDLQGSGGTQPHFSLLEPASVPAPLLAYTLAVHYGMDVPNIHALCEAADACYEHIQPFARSQVGKTEAFLLTEADLPLRDAFQSESPGDASGVRFKAMRNLIALLREDL